MKKNWITATLVLLVITGVAFADRDRGEVVMVGSPPAAGQPVTVADVDADAAFDTVWSNQADIVKFELPGSQMRSSCDDAEDCAKTIKDTCAIVSPVSPAQNVTVTYNGRKGSCNGTCGNGQSVSVVCVSGSRR